VLRNHEAADARYRDEYCAKTAHPRNFETMLRAPFATIIG
jgi:hypothetical protein